VVRLTTKYKNEQLFTTRHTPLKENVFFWEKTQPNRDALFIAFMFYLKMKLYMFKAIKEIEKIDNVSRFGP
jgi:hypothetical protein